VSLTKLTILIPTYGGADRLSGLLSLLDSYLPNTIKSNLEILISDNHSDPEISITSQLGLSDLVKIVKPPIHLLTAEENLLFAINSATGSHCWVLGDDDFPLQHGLKFMTELIENEDFDLMVFNSLGLNAATGAWDINRLELDSILNQMSFTEFVKRAGFWSVTAGFSTLVFKKSSFQIGFMEELHREGLKIYSHVTTLLSSYHDKKFVAVAIPLVKYSSNPFDEEHASAEVKGEHWVSYANKQFEPYRNPWTISFISQIVRLQEKGVFHLRDLLDTLDQGHLGHRFFIFDVILGFIVDQIIYQSKNQVTNILSLEKLEHFLSQLMGIDGTFDEIIKEIWDASNSDSSLQKLEIISARLFSPEAQLHRRFVAEISGGKIYRSPFGLLWTPFPHNLDMLLASLTTPNAALFAKTVAELELQIADFKRNHPFYAMQDISLFINTAGLNSSIVKLDKLMRLVPRFLRNLWK